MTIETVSRRAGPFTGDGSTTAFPFEFKVFSESQVSVQSAVGDASETTLTLDEDYTVALNSDQDENPGGTVTLVSALAEDARLTIISAIPSTQLVKVTNYDRFYPTTFNDEFDKLTGLIQQLEERADRAVTVDATDTMTPAEFKEKLLTTADAAREAAEAAEAEAKAYASQAQTSASAAKTSELQTAAYAEAATVVAPIADQVKTVANIADDVSTVSSVAPDVRTVAGVSTSVTKVAGIAAETQVVGSNIATISRATGLLNHTSDLQALSQHVNDLHRVGQDLLVSDEYEVSYDLGLVTDGVEPTGKVTGGVLKSVADHLDDCIHPVGQKIDDVHDVAANLATISRATGLVSHVADIAALSPHIDDLHRVGQDLLVSDNTDVSYDYGSVSDAVEPETVVTGGVLKNVSDHIEDCIHPVAQKLDDIHTVGTIAADVTVVANVATEVKTTANMKDTVVTIADNMASISRAANVEDHADDLAALSQHIDDLHRVGQDLQVTEVVESLDFGLVSDPEQTTTTVTGGILKTVADNMDGVKAAAKVEPYLADIEAAAKVEENIEDIKAANLHVDEIHVVGQDLQGVSAGSLDFGRVIDETDNVITVTGGYIKSVGEMADEVQAVAGVKDSVVAVAAMADQLDPLLAAAETITEVTQTDYKTIFLNGLSE